MFEVRREKVTEPSKFGGNSSAKVTNVASEGRCTRKCSELQPDAENRTNDNAGRALIDCTFKDISS